jgi:hypothetical protein
MMTWAEGIPKMEVLFAPTVYQAKNSSDVPMSFFACLKGTVSPV